MLIWKVEKQKEMNLIFNSIKYIENWKKDYILLGIKYTGNILNEAWKSL